MIKAYIIIELNNGKKIRYVRDILYDNNGDSGVYYGYGDSAGDSFGAQGDTYGKVGHDFETIETNSTGDSWLIFPESAGDTRVYARRNSNMSGDTEGLLCMIRTQVKTDAISDIYILEEVAPERLVAT